MSLIKQIEELVTTRNSQLQTGIEQCEQSIETCENEIAKPNTSSNIIKGLSLKTHIDEDQIKLGLKQLLNNNDSHKELDNLAQQLELEFEITSQEALETLQAASEKFNVREQRENYCLQAKTTCDQSIQEHQNFIDKNNQYLDISKQVNENCMQEFNGDDLDECIMYSMGKLAEEGYGLI